MRALLVLDVVGLTPDLLGADTPALSKLAAEGFQASLEPVLPAVTCTSQATMLTGTPPRDHGVVGNGWYFRDRAEVALWHQSNHLVAGKKVWERGREREAGFTCAKLFWWHNMYSSADWSVTPRPIYTADGRKLPSFYTFPKVLKASLEAQLGNFPLFEFWGPTAGIGSTEWIGRAASLVIEECRPTLTLVYLPHLDYDLQRFGPGFEGVGAALRAVDRVAGELIEQARARDMEVVVLSEYGITEVSDSVSINRLLRERGLLEVQETLGWELLDAGASRAFAVSDHQIAHVYVRDPADVPSVRDLLLSADGIESVLDHDGKAEHGLDHPRSGELVAVAAPGRWFDYYYWLDDERAPDFARTVDIHRKPGYDPVELFLDREQRLVKLKILTKLLKKSLGFRYLMDVIPLTPELVRGSHGRLPARPGEGPLLISSSRRQERASLHLTEVGDLLLDTVFEGG